MSFTRDGLVWTVTFVAAILSFLGTQLGMLHMAFPSLGAVGEARIKLAITVVGFISGWFKMSPLPLSQSHPLATYDGASTVLSPFNSKKPIA